MLLITVYVIISNTRANKIFDLLEIPREKTKRLLNVDKGNIIDLQKEIQDSPTFCIWLTKFFRVIQYCYFLIH